MDPRVKIAVRPFNMLPPQLAQLAALDHFAINKLVSHKLNLNSSLDESEAL